MVESLGLPLLMIAVIIQVYLAGKRDGREEREAEQMEIKQCKMNTYDQQELRKFYLEIP